MVEQRQQLSMAQTVAGLQTKSAKIRALSDAGYARSDIARYLGIRYQHVRNVLVQSKKRESPTSMSDQANREEWLQVAPDGRLVIPAAYRRLLGIESGGHVFATVKDGALMLVSRAAALAGLQAIVARYAGEGSMTDAFIEERRREAQRENQG